MLLPGWQRAQAIIEPAHPSPAHTLALAAVLTPPSRLLRLTSACFPCPLPLGTPEAIMALSTKAMGKCPDYQQTQISYLAMIETG